MKLVTRNSEFELSDTGLGMYELKKTADYSPGKRAVFKEGEVMKAKTIVAPKLGAPIILKDERGKEIFNSKENVLKPPTGSIR